MEQKNEIQECLRLNFWLYCDAISERVGFFNVIGNIKKIYTEYYRNHYSVDKAAKLLEQDLKNERVG